MKAPSKSLRVEAYSKDGTMLAVGYARTKRAALALAAFLLHATDAHGASVPWLQYTIER